MTNRRTFLTRATAALAVLTAPLSALASRARANPAPAKPFVHEWEKILLWNGPHHGRDIMATKGIKSVQFPVFDPNADGTLFRAANYRRSDHKVIHFANPHDITSKDIVLTMFFYEPTA